MSANNVAIEFSTWLVNFARIFNRGSLMSRAFYTFKINNSRKLVSGTAVGGKKEARCIWGLRSLLSRIIVGISYLGGNLGEAGLINISF